jgi:predicted nucleic acid-binding protein
LALSVAGHEHRLVAWNWLARLSTNDKLIVSRYTQLGLLRLLTNPAIMGDQTLTLSEAWRVYDGWLGDPRVEFCPEPREVGSIFRKLTKPLATLPASKAIGDCWLLAFAAGIQATLVTFDRALYGLAKKQGHSAAIPS